MTDDRKQGARLRITARTDMRIKLLGDEPVSTLSCSKPTVALM
jgi:hypothetical protein